MMSITKFEGDEKKISLCMFLCVNHPHIGYLSLHAYINMNDDIAFFY